MILGKEKANKCVHPEMQGHTESIKCFTFEVWSEEINLSE